MFAALDDPKRAPVYWLFAAVYAAPALHYGLGFDALSAVSLAACFAHVQIEKAAQKEAVRLPLPPGGLAGVARAAASPPIAPPAPARFSTTNCTPKASLNAVEA